MPRLPEDRQMTDLLAEWKQFFAPAIAAPATRDFRVVRRRGEPLLLLPMDTHAATLCLGLYPAQTSIAKAARIALRFALSAHIPLMINRLSLPWDDAAPLSAFLRGQAGASAFDIGVLLGNPRTEGRRWIISVIVDGSVRTVVKA